MIRYFDIPQHSPDWHKFRESGIGSSESSAVLELNKYTPKAKLFYEKIGDIKPWMGDNEAMFHGRNFEGYVLSMWEYYDFETFDYAQMENISPEKRAGYLERYKAGNKFRTMTPNKAYAVNDKYPWLFDSVDAMAAPGQIRFDTGETYDKPFCLEAKTITSQAAAEWELGIPVGYLIQATHHMIVHEVDYAEIVVLKDGRYLTVLPVPFREQLANSIIVETRRFWDNIVQAREARKKRDEAYRIYGDDSAQYKHYASIVMSLEPPAQTGDAYKEFMQERYRDTKDVIVGDIQDLTNALNAKVGASIKKGSDNFASLSKNILFKKMIENGVREIVLPGDFGKVQILKRGDTPYVDIRLKGIKDDEQKVLDFIRAFKGGIINQHRPASKEVQKRTKV